MEAVPRLPMLSFETKPYFPKNAQFGSDLMNVSINNFNYVSQVDFSKDIIINSNDCNYNTNSSHLFVNGNKINLFIIIYQLIRQHYQEDPNNYNEEIQQLEKLRQQATKLNKDIDGIAILKRYFCQLYFLQKRFPMLKDLSVSSEISW